MKLSKIFQKITTGKTDYTEYLKSKGVKMGDNVNIIDSRIDETYSFLITIGNNVTLTGARVLCHDASTKMALGLTKIGKVEIGDNVFIGKNTVILPNSFIGSNTIIGAGAVVSGKIPPNSVVVGNPSKVICSFEEYIEKHKSRINEATTISKSYKALSETEKSDIINNIDGIWYAP